MIEHLRKEIANHQVTNETNQVTKKFWSKISDSQVEIKK